MTFGYSGAENRDLIEYFEFIDEVLKINYLDGTYGLVPYSEKEVEKIKKLMLQQAIDRQNSTALVDETKERNENLGMAIFLFLYASLYFIKLHKMDFCVSSLISSTAMLFDVYSLYLLKKSNDKIKELNKYAIFLKYHEKIEKYSLDPKLYKKIKGEDNYLDINTLDEYSLEELKQIRRNIRVIERSIPSFDAIHKHVSYRYR